MEYDFDGNAKSISLDGVFNTIGLADYSDWVDNQTRRTAFSTRELRRWSEAVEDVYGSECYVVFTPEAPIVATAPTDSATIGVSLAPLAKSEGDDEI